MSSPVKHLIVGTIGGGGIYAVSHDWLLTAGFFFGSWLIMDIDHILAYWRAIKFAPRKIINIKEFFKWNDGQSERFLQEPRLCWLPLHTIEFLLFWLCLVQFLFINSFFAPYLFCFSVLVAMIIHFLMDRIELGMKTSYANKYCHSAIEFWWRKNFGEEAIYEDVWGVKAD